MPIRSDDFERGKTLDSMTNVVEDFLRKHRENAYLAAELFEAMRGRKLYDPFDMFEIMNVLYVLGEKGTVEGRYVENSQGYQVFYRYRGP